MYNWHITPRKSAYTCTTQQSNLVKLNYHKYFASTPNERTLLARALRDDHKALVVISFFFLAKYIQLTTLLCTRKRTFPLVNNFKRHLTLSDFFLSMAQFLIYTVYYINIFSQYSYLDWSWIGVNIKFSKNLELLQRGK